MADNTTLDPGTGGDVIATDDVAGLSAKVQYVKLMDGTADASGRIAGDATNGLDVDVTRVQGSVAVTNAGTFATQESQILTDNAAFTDTTSKVFPVGLIFDEVAGTALTENDVAAPRIDSKRAQVLVIEDETTRGRRTTVTASNALKVDNSGVTQPVSDAGGSLTVDNGGTFTVQDSEKVADDAAFTVGTTKLQPIGFLADQTATDSVNEGDLGAPRMTLDRKPIVTIAPSSDTEGLSIFRTLDADETEEDVKTSAGKLYGWYLYNDGAVEVYVKFYNATAANTTVGSTTPILTIPVPAGAAANVEFTNGITFGTALCIAATTGVADADTAAPAANQVIANVFYQ